MTREHIFTLEVDEEEVQWKCVVSEHEIVTYENDAPCQTFRLTTTERKPGILQLDTQAKVFDEVLPLQVENGMPFLRVEDSWLASDTTKEDRLQANIRKYKRESFMYFLLGLVMVLVYLVNKLAQDVMGDIAIVFLIGALCMVSALYTMARLNAEMQAMGRKLDWRIRLSDLKKQP